MSGWLIAGLWLGASALLTLTLCRAAAHGDHPDREE